MNRNRMRRQQEGGPLSVEMLSTFRRGPLMPSVAPRRITPKARSLMSDSELPAAYQLPWSAYKR